jgi:putative restriction endonuclease
LLRVFDLIARGKIKNNLIEVTPEVCETFTLYWPRVMPPEGKSNIAMPFFYLTSDGFWHLIPYLGKENELRTAIDRNIQLTTINQIKSVALGAKLDIELFELMREKESREVWYSMVPQPQRQLCLPHMLKISLFFTRIFANGNFF